MLVLKTVTFYFIYCLFIQGQVAEMQNQISGFSLDSVDVIGILYFLECLNDGEYIWI